MQDGVGRSLLGAAVLDRGLRRHVPPDSGITQAGQYSLHWAGQILIDTAGDYAFQLDTDDGHRLRIDDQLDARRHGQGAPQRDHRRAFTSSPGWHDLVVEQTQYGGLRPRRPPGLQRPRARRQADPARPRPAAGAAHRPGRQAPRTTRTAPSRRWAARPTTFDPARSRRARSWSGSTPYYGVNDPHLTDLEVALMSPDGSTRGPATGRGRRPRGGSTYEARATHDLDGKDAGGTWHLEVTDTRRATAAAARSAASITVHYTGGQPPIDRSPATTRRSTTSAAPAASTRSRGAASTPTGTSVAVRVRACPSADAGACASIAVVRPGRVGRRPVAGHRAVPPVPGRAVLGWRPGRRVQLDLDLVPPARPSRAAAAAPRATARRPPSWSRSPAGSGRRAWPAPSGRRPGRATRRGRPAAPPGSPCHAGERPGTGCRGRPRG